MSDEKELGTGEYGVPTEVENTAKRDRAAAEDNARTAVNNAITTGAVLADLRAAVGQSRRLHAENHYVPRLRAIFRGEG